MYDFAIIGGGIVGIGQLYPSVRILVLEKKIIRHYIFKREGYKKIDFDLRDFTEIITYPGLWKLAAKYADQAIAEMIHSFTKTAMIS